MRRILSASRSVLALGALLVLLAPAVTAEDGADQSAFHFGFTAALGTETLDGVAYQSLGLIPDFGIGPLGVGIDLTLHFQFYQQSSPNDQPGSTFGVYLRDKDFWDNSLSFSQNLDKYLSRVLYVRWGQKGDPLYVQAGLLPSTTLGTGFVVGGYNNGALRPTLKYTGLEIDASGELIGLPYGGVESFVGNLSTFDVLGARAYVKPFGLLLPDNDFLKQVQFGLTVAADTNPYAQAAQSVVDTRLDGSVLALGLDGLMPVYSSELFSAAVTADAATQGAHVGGAIGVGGKALGLLNWGLQNRFLGENFLPDYFDQGYEVNRVAKFEIYQSSDVVVPGTIGWQASLGTSLLGDALTFGATLSGPWSAQTNVYAQPQLQGLATLKPGILPVSLNAYYIKNGLTDLAKVLSPEHALIGAQVGYTLGAVTLSIIYDLRYLNAGEVGPDGKQWISTSRVETAVKF